MGANRLLLRFFCRFGMVAIVLNAGCTVGVVTSGEVYGTYRADYSFGYQTLTLRHDGTYSQQVVLTGISGETVHSGTWHYDQANESIIYPHCLLLTDVYGRLKKDYAVPQDANCAKPVERRFLWAGGIRIGSVEGELFIKQ